MHMKKMELTGSFSRFLALYKFLCLYVCKTYKKTTKAYLNRYKKGKVFPYSLPSVGPGADPGVQAVSPQVT